MVRVLIVLAAVCAVAYGKAVWPTPRLDGRIVGGKDANIEDLPYQLSLLSYGSHICGASIISDEWVLTAAHCVYMSDPEEISFRAGSSIKGSGGTIHQADQVIWHPKYDSWTTDYDYALIHVQDKFNLGQPGVQAVAVTDKEPEAGTQVIISGWGALSAGGSSPRQLQKVEVPIVARNVCEEQYIDYGITSRMICAGLIEGGKDACQGDSGGPLVANGQLSGIVSWGVGCAYPNYAGVYTNVANQRDWIRSVSNV